MLQILLYMKDLGVRIILVFEGDVVRCKSRLISLAYVLLTIYDCS